ncbi:hypothetical protein WJX72_001099 [[Myrmecia] bisecta]|uniref:RBR-type E3 ubiquitin transferase n=1 Tax=[Myrmecia] bisecta TaxID=41462 RepID=A0AAW1Q8F9_9CHLO
MSDMYDSDSAGAYNSDDEESMEFLSDDEGANKANPASSASTYTVIDTAKLAQVQDEALDSVINILGCSRSTARSLLIHFRWNTETLFGTLAERGEAQVCRLAGVTSRSEETPTQPVSGNGEVSCGICMCDVAHEEATTMDCGHGFCNTCWLHHFQVQISEGKSRRLPCMGFKCGAICEESKVKALLKHEPDLLNKYELSLLQSYIDDNNMVKWCPSVPHCGHALQVTGEPYCEPVCACGIKFCFACTEDPHSPCTCDMWRRWKQKGQDDSETKNWLTANTKPCPKCSKPVEKNGGCNLVLCMCGQAFCWLCGAATGRAHDWHQIQGHSCGRYKDEMDKKIDEAARNVQRYMHYHTRWDAHMQSQKLEQAQSGGIQEKIAKLEDDQDTLQDFSWLAQALEQLFHARRILGYSYAFAFYMFGNEMFRDEITPDQNKINQNLFEDQQQQLEAEVERLSGLIETPIDKMNGDMRLRVINSTVNIDKRIVKMYELVENDLLGKLQFSVNYIAPYKGQSTLRAADGATELASAAMPSSSSTPEVIDLSDSPVHPSARQASVSPPPDAVKKRQRLDQQPAAAAGAAAAASRSAARSPIKTRAR